MLKLKCSLFAGDRQLDENEVDDSQFNAVGMIGRGFINLPLSGNS